MARFLLLTKWRTPRTGAFLAIFRIGKVIGMSARFLLVLGLSGAIAALIANPENLYAISFGAGPALFFLALGEAVARYLMDIGGAEHDT